ncbi:hypothetical protein J6W34_04560 [bacterium]|nr:hypothetical protein [bacterium]
MAINNKIFYDVDYESIKVRLKEFLSQQTVLKDYNFEGSAISNWLNLVCYVIYYINTIANFISNEMFIASATIDNNVLKHSYQLNYLPKRKVAPKIKVKVSLSDSSTPVIIPLHTNVQMGSLNLVTLQEYRITEDTIIDMYQGNIVEVNHEYEGEDFENIILDDKETVDNDYFKVFVNDVLWTSVYDEKNYLGAKNYFIKYVDNFEVIFDQKNSLFAVPEEMDMIRVVYLKTDGSLYNSNFNTTLTLSDTFENSENIILSLPEGEYLKGGQDEESYQSIANMAPLFFTSAGRCVTEDDYNYRITLSNLYKEMSDMIVYSGHNDIVNYYENPVEIMTSENKLDKGFYIWSGYKKTYVKSADFNVFSEYEFPNAEQAIELYNYIDNYKFMQIFGKYRMPSILVLKPYITFTYIKGNLIDLTMMIDDLKEYLESFEGFNKSINITDIINYLANKYAYLKYIDGIFRYHSLSFKPLVSIVLQDEVNELQIGDTVVSGNAEGIISRIDVEIKRILVTRTSEEQFEENASVNIIRGSLTVLSSTITNLWAKIIVRLHKYLDELKGEVDGKLIYAVPRTETDNVTHTDIVCGEADNYEQLLENATEDDVIGYVNYTTGYIEFNDIFTWNDYNIIPLELIFRNESGYKGYSITEIFETALDFQDTVFTYEVEQ